MDSETIEEISIEIRIRGEYVSQRELMKIRDYFSNTFKKEFSFRFRRSPSGKVAIIELLRV